MGGVGEASDFAVALGPFDHFDKVFFDSPPVRSIEADGEAIWARGLVWLEHPNGSLYFFFFNFLGEICINFLTDFRGKILKKI